MFGGGFFFAKKAAGEPPASFGTDWTVKSARPSEDRKRRPYPVSGFPASCVKTVVGISTTAPVSGTAYPCQPIDRAAAAAGERVKAKAMKEHCNLMIVSPHRQINCAKPPSFRGRGGDTIGVW